MHAAYRLDEQHDDEKRRQYVYETVDRMSLFLPRLNLLFIDASKSLYLKEKA